MLLPLPLLPTRTTASPLRMSEPTLRRGPTGSVGAPAPLQAAGAVGMAFGADYYNHMALEYRERRERLVPALREAGFQFSVPEGAYYVLADFPAISQGQWGRMASTTRPSKRWIERSAISA